MQSNLAPWDYSLEAGEFGVRGKQFGDDSRFSNGIGVGNIGARYASWGTTLGAHVVAWDAISTSRLIR